MIEIFQIYFQRLIYFFDIENWIDLYLYTSSIAFMAFGLASECQCPEPWQWEFGAVTMLIAWLNFVYILKTFFLTGVYVLMFFHILKTVLRMILVPALFIVSFGLTFFMLFFRPVSTVCIDQKKCGLFELCVCVCVCV